MTSPRYVLDASVGIKLYLAEELSEAAEEIFRQIQVHGAPDLFVPDLFFAECASIFRKHVLRFGYPAEIARRNITQILELPLTRVSMPEIIESAMAIALDCDISVYDACYVATANAVDAPLITADLRLVNSLGGTDHKVSYLGKLQA